MVAAGRRRGGGERRRERHGRGARASPWTARQLSTHAARDRDPRPAPARARWARATLVRARLDDRPVRADPGGFGRARHARGGRNARRLAGTAHHDQRVGRRGGRDRHRGRPAVRRCLAPTAARRVRQVLRRPLRGLLEPRLLRPDGLPVPCTSGSGSRSGSHLQGVGVRRREGIRHLGRAVGRLPAQGRPGPVHPIHVPLPVRRRVHRPVRTTAGRLVGRHPERCDGRIDCDLRRRSTGPGRRPG